MNNLYDIFNALQKEAIENASLDYHDNRLEYSTPEITLHAFEIDKKFAIDMFCQGQKFSFYAPCIDNVYALFSGIISGSVVPFRVDDIIIRLCGYDNKKVARFSRLKSVILTLFGAILGFFSLIMSADLICALFSGEISFSTAGVIVLFVMAELISVCLIKYAALQSEYKRNIIMDIIGFAIIGFWGMTAAVMMLEDYDSVKGYGIDTIGALVCMIIFIALGVVLLILSKRCKESEKVMLLSRTPVLPNTADADAIFSFVDKACPGGNLPLDIADYVHKEFQNPFDLLLHKSALQLSIPIDETLRFEELLTAVSTQIANNFDDTDIGRVYFERYGEY